MFPTAPPRFLPEWGFIDSVSDLTGVHVSHASRFDERSVQPLRGGSLDARGVRADDRLAAWPRSRARASRAVLWRLYPLLIAFVIIATANHFILDAVLGALTAGARLWARAGWDG